MKNKRNKSLVLHLTCSCGQAIMAVFTSGIKALTKTVPCPRCHDKVNTDGTVTPMHKRKKCPWCTRSNWLNVVTKHCIHCGYDASPKKK